MSRCFPYPPPGYSRNGATYESLIESIKLQKVKEKSKSERKKEKKEKKAKKEKKEQKEKRKDEEKPKAKLQNSNEYQEEAHEVLQSSVDFKEAHNKRTKANNEQLERSDLTEEHGQPISSNNQGYSSDSTQNSNKRKRDDANVLPDASTGHGKLIKIRLLKKQKGPEETLCSNSGRTDTQSLSGADARLNNWKLLTSGNTDASVPQLVSSNRNSGVPATSGRENNAAAQGICLSQTKSTPSLERPGTKNNDQQGLHFNRKQLAPGSALKHEIRTSNPNKTDVPVPSRLKKSNVEVFHSSRQQPVPNHGRPILSQSRLENEMPTSSWMMPPAPSVSRKIDVKGFRSAVTPVVPPNHLKQSSDSIKNKSTGTGKRSIDEMTVPDDSGPTRFEKKKEDSMREVPPVLGTSKEGKVVLTKSEKKMQKKHKKYEKVIGSWVPPVVEAQLVDDEDWLSGSGKKARLSCSKADDVEMCHEAALSLWQPCARFLVEADIHALPYTVPF